MIFKKHYVIGLDIGISSVKLAQFIKNEDGLCLVKLGLEEFEITADESLRQKKALSCLKKLLHGIDIKKSKFFVSINCPRTSVRKVTVPAMPRAELRDALRLALKNYFPFPVGDAILDFKIERDIVEKGVRESEVFVAVSPEKTIDQYLSLLDKLGIKPVSLLPIHCALQKLAEVSGSKDKTVCFLDLGGHFTELAIFKGKDLQFSRKILLGGINFTQAMTDILVSDKGRTGLSFDEAEKIKREVGIPPEGEARIIDEKISSFQILSMLRSPLEQLAAEIERCFDYYREAGGGKIDSLFLFGGGASLKGIDRFLSELLGIEVKLGYPSGNIRAIAGLMDQQKGISHQLAAAIGAALSAAEGINLLPPGIKDELRRASKRAVVEVIAVSAVLFLAFIYIGLRIQLSNLEKIISVVRMEFSSLKLLLEDAKPPILINEISASQPDWEDVFKELSNIIPNHIYLTGLSAQDNTLRMQGVVVSHDPEGSLADFLLSIEKGIFNNVKLISKEIKGKSGNEFELICWVDYQ